MSEHYRSDSTIWYEDSYDHAEQENTSYWEYFDLNVIEDYKKSPCFMCQEMVYYYKNEDGGFAMFDDIDPWVIHSCWEEIRTNNPEKMKEEFDIVLNNKNIKPDFEYKLLIWVVIIIMALILVITVFLLKD